MMTINKLIKNLLGVNKIKVKSVEYTNTNDGCKKIIVDVELYKSEQCRCPLCSGNKKLPRYDSSKNIKTYRGLDLGGILLDIRCEVPRVTCKKHGVITSRVPFAFHNSRFTKDFDLTVAWMAKSLSKSAISEYMRISWLTVGRCVSRAREYLEPNPSSRLNDLKRIGIDETSYSKGHKYITTVINHDTNTVVWVGKNHGKSVLEGFFKSLSEQQLSQIEVVSDDGARWISECVKEYCPLALRCTDPFHAVLWAQDALDEIRKESWRSANKELKELNNDIKRDRGRPKKDDEDSKELSIAKKKVIEIKNSRYALSKAPENLTENQEVKLALIKSKDNRLYRAYLLKESLRNLLKIKDPSIAEKEINKWISWASRSRIDSFKSLAKKIKRHKDYILNFIKTGISNARVEANNNKISLLVHRSYGFKNFNNMVDLIMLVCSDLDIPLPNRPDKLNKTPIIKENPAI